jgi:hypothetical protein
MLNLRMCVCVCVYVIIIIIMNQEIPLGDALPLGDNPTAVNKYYYYYAR